MLLASTPAGIGLAVVAPNLIDLFYEPEFGDSVRPLQILALQIPITGMDTILVTALIASERLRKYLIVAAGAAVLNPILCIVLIQLSDRALGQRSDRRGHRHRPDRAGRHDVRDLPEHARGDGPRDRVLVPCAAPSPASAILPAALIDGDSVRRPRRAGRAWASSSSAVAAVRAAGRLDRHRAIRPRTGAGRWCRSPVGDEGGGGGAEAIRPGPVAAD